MKRASWPYPKFFAHRGGGTLAPENTLEALQLGHSLGYQAAEFDVKLTVDGVAILMHDAVLGRTSTGSGEVATLHYDDLAKLDAGSWHCAAFAGARVPRLTEVALWLKAHGMRANVEIKPCPGREDETGHLIGGLCRDLWLEETVQPLVSSFSHDALAAARRVAPNLSMGFLVKDVAPEHYAVLEKLQCVSLHCHHAALTQSHVAKLHKRGYRVMVYTVNEVQRAELLLGWGVDGIFTDNLSQMKADFPHEFAS